MKTLNFCNHGLQICKEGVLFWLEKEIAIVSDLHLEKGSSYASSGQYIPPYDSEETLLKLLDILKLVLMNSFIDLHLLFLYLKIF